MKLSSSVQNGIRTITYKWEQLSGVALTFSSTEQNTVTFSAPEVADDETVSVRLTVTDSSGSSASNTADFTIEDLPLGLAINSGFPSALSGHEDDVLAYIWSDINGSEGST